MSDHSQALQSHGDAVKFVAFMLGAQHFCIDIMSVREIRGWTPATPLPLTPEFVRGVVNLRGAVLPVIDLSACLGFDMIEPTSRHAVIIVEAPGQDVGYLVDSVSEILEISPDVMQPAPETASTSSVRLLQGIIAREKDVISVLSLETLIPTTLQHALAEACP